MIGIPLAIASRQAVLLGSLMLVGIVGAIAILSPRRFAALATRSGRWVDTKKALEVLDKRVDIDQYVLPFSRLLGVAVIAAVAVLCWVLVRYS